MLSKALLKAGSVKAGALLQLGSHCNTHPCPWGSRGYAATPGTALSASSRAGGHGLEREQLLSSDIQTQGC